MARVGEQDLHDVRSARRGCRQLVGQLVALQAAASQLVVHPGEGVVLVGVGRVVDQPEVSTYFTPIAITLNVDSFEHLDFTTRPDQLLVYTLVQGDESVVVEFTPGSDGSGNPFEPHQLAFDTSGYVQMELQGLDSAPAEE